MIEVIVFCVLRERQNFERVRRKRTFETMGNDESVPSDSAYRTGRRISSDEEDVLDDQEEYYRENGYVAPRGPPPRLGKIPSSWGGSLPTVDLDDVKPKYMSSDEIEDRAKAFEKKQRERYRSYLAFLLAKLKKFNVRTVVTIFMFECNMLAREISVITREPPMHFARKLGMSGDKPVLPQGYDLFFYLDRAYAESICRQKGGLDDFYSQNPFGSGLHHRDSPVYSVKTYAVDIVPFNHKLGLRLRSPSQPKRSGFFEGIEPRAKFQEDPRPFWIRGFMSIRRLAAQIHEKDMGSM